MALLLSVTTLRSMASFAFDEPRGESLSAAPSSSLPQHERAAPQDLPLEVQATLGTHCWDCHHSDQADGGLDLDAISLDFTDLQTRERWIRIYDRVVSGEMPPESDSATTRQLTKQLQPLGALLIEVDRQEIQRQGRGARRRLTRVEYEQVLRDVLLLPRLDVRDHLPADREARHFRRSTSVADVSAIQLNAYLQAAEFALQQAIADRVEPLAPTTYRFLGRQLFAETSTFGNREAMFFARDNRPIDNALLKAEPTNPDIELALFRSAHWPYYGYPQQFVAPETGQYRLRINARAVIQLPGFELQPAPQSIALTFRARKPSGPDVSGDVRATGGWIDVDGELDWYETTIELKAGETFEYSLLGLPVPLARNVDGGEPTYRYPPLPAHGQPGLAVRELELTGPLAPDSWPSPAHRALYGELAFHERSEQEKLASPTGLSIEVESRQPEADAVALVESLLERLAIDELTEADRRPFRNLVLSELANGTSFTDATFFGFQAVLCSRHAIFAAEAVQESDHAAIAQRLSLTLFSGPPDERLRTLARQRRLRDREVLVQELDRMMADDRFERFVAEFTEDWLDLKHLYRGEIDERLYPEYRFDAYLVESMEQETRSFVRDLFRFNEPVTTIIAADFVYANDRLARHYGLEALEGSGVRRVAIPTDSVYGGLLTQGALLKVTANGVSTSPIVRGAWIMDRLLGEPPPPPPAAVPAVEPDLRGATTIRELLARHAADQQCAKCHARFDPVGLALENFDVLGGWRQRYRSLGEGEPVTGIDRAGHDFAYALAAPIDPSGELLDGSKFGDVRDLKRLWGSNPRPLARNLIHQLTLFATGTPIRLSEREEVEAILDRCAERGYRAGDLLRELFCSSIVLGSHGLKLNDQDNDQDNDQEKSENESRVP